MFKTRNNNNEQKIITRTVLFTHVYGVKDLKKKTNAVKTFKENTKREKEREKNHRSNMSNGHQCSNNDVLMIVKM